MNDAVEGRPPPMRRARVLTLSLTLIVLFALTPMFCALLALGLAAANGCALNEGSATSCLLFGAQIGPLLHRLLVAGWYALFTIPIGMVALLAWVVALVALRRR